LRNKEFLVPGEDRQLAENTNALNKLAGSGSRVTLKVTQQASRRRVARKLDCITINPALMNGQACIRGMRLTVRRVVEAAALYPNRSDLRREYPELEDEDIAQALDFAAQNLVDQILSLESA
jgi:uncharacterized protein (DUF433 family)